MAINDSEYGEFDNELQDEDLMDAHPQPMAEIGYDIQRDCGSGSYAEDGRREVREDRPIMDGEIGSAAMYGPTEIGEDEMGFEDDAVGAVKKAVARATQAVKNAVVAKKTAPPHVAAKHAAIAHHAVAAAEHALASGPYATHGAVEIGGIEDEDAVGVVKQAVAKATQAVKKAIVAKKTAPPHVAAKHAAVAHRAVAAAEHAIASGPYSSHGAVEIGNGPYASHGAFELGAASAADRPGSELGSGWAANEGMTEIGAGEDNIGTDSLVQPFETFMLEPDRLGDDEVGSAAMYGPTEIGYDDELGEDDALGAAKKAVAKAALAVKHAPPHVAAKHVAAAHQAVAKAQHAAASGPYSSHGAVEIGAAAAADRDGTELGEDEMGEDEIGDDELGEDDLGAGWAANAAAELGAGWYPGEGASEIGEEQVKAAVVKVVEKARDNRQPAPPMRAVDVDAPLENENGFLSDIVIGATVAAPAAAEPFPLLSQLLLRAGATVEPRVVRVDTEESYKQFRTSQSPELSAVKEKLEEHDESDDIDDDISDLVMLGEEAQAVEAQKRVEMWMPTRFEGKVEAWKQGDKVFASIALPGCDGEVRICTAFEPMRKCVEEMMRHASETNNGAAIVGVLPAMGCVLGAGTVMKEMAAAAPAILARPEAQVKMPFVVRIEPKTSPNLSALVMLAAAAKTGNTQAVSEWQKLASLSAPAVKSAMLEAADVAKAATGG